MCVCVCVCVWLVCECLPVLEDACASVHVSLSAHACAFVPGTGRSRSRYFVTLQKYHYRESPGNNTDPARTRACSHTRTHECTHIRTNARTYARKHARTHARMAGWLAGPQAWLAGPRTLLAGPWGGDGRTNGQTAYLHILQDCRFSNIHALECSRFQIKDFSVVLG